MTRLLAAALVAFTTGRSPAEYRSHPPVRPLPLPSDRPADATAARSLYVDPARGDDAAAGSQEAPWKTLTRAARDLRPGDVLYLRGGVYHEHVTLRLAGTAGQPITIRAVPNELPVLDGGLPEFLDSPQTAWEPCPGGAPGEYRSTKTYADPTARPNGTNVLGHFADSMVPLQGYRFLADLRSGNVYWNVTNKVGQEGDIYCGPGLYHDPATGRIHARLAPTRMPYLPAADNYAGETDPRKLPLVVAAGPESTLTLDRCRHVRVQDVVVRGSRSAAVSVLGCEAVEFDGLTVYGGASCFRVAETGGLRVANTACRGIAAPWTFRGSLKYRAIEARLFSASGWAPRPVPNREFELAYCEFTDSVDGVFIGGVRGVKFHHNRLDNVTDDGIFLTAGTGYDGVTHGGDIDISQNLFSRCLTVFAFGVGHGRQKAVPGGLQTGSGVNVFRNVFDLRAEIRYHQPASPNEPQALTSHGRVCGDHSSPAWEPLNVYHNTVLLNTDRVRNYFMAEGTGQGTRRRVFNNLVVESAKKPGAAFPPAAADFAADGNLFWTAEGGATAELFAKFRASPAFAESKKKYAPGWGANDRVADPKLAAYLPDGKRPADLTLTPGSPAVDMGVSLPAEWPDPLRAADAGKPDAGAVPLGAKPWHIGVRQSCRR
jgi:hypothetical protein